MDRKSDQSGPLLARYGPPESVYKPSPGQTLAGVAVGACVAVFGLTLALFGEGLESVHRLGALGLGGAGLASVYILWRLRKWRLMICERGLVQVRSWAVDEILWREVREVVQTRSKGFGDPTLRVTLYGPLCEFTVTPVNFGSSKELYRVL